MITLRQLRKAHAALTKASTPARKCPNCGVKLFGGEGPCMECRGLKFAKWEIDGAKFQGLIDRDGTPVFFGGENEMRRLAQEHNRRKADGAGLSIANR